VRRGWLAPVLFAVVCLAAVAGGYLIGSENATTEAEAADARKDATKTAFAATRASSYAEALNRGFPAGELAGKIEGKRVGAEDGAAAGLHIVEREIADTTLTGGGGGGGGREDQPVPADGSTLPLPSIQSSSITGDVLVVGDSLEVLTSPYLSDYLPSNRLVINAVGGYSSLQIFELFQESYDPSQTVVVFDAGTNDNPNYPEILAGRLQAVSEIVGDRCMVVPTIHGLPVDGADDTGKNQVVAAFAASRPNVVTPDWHGFVAAHPELMQPDNLHPTPEGADARAQLIAEGVSTCFAFGGGGDDLFE
jgi:hypothetical protein